MMYYGHRQPVETDLDDFIPSENAEGYDEGIKILLDLPDYSNPVKISKFTEAQIIQNLGRRIYKRVLAIQKKNSPSMEVKRFSSDLNYLEIDNKLSATGNLNDWASNTIMSHEWDFTGTPGNVVAPILYDPLTFPFYQYGYYGHGLNQFKYESAQFTTSPTGIQLPWASGFTWEGIAAKVETDYPVQILEFDTRVTSTNNMNLIRILFYENYDLTGNLPFRLDINPYLYMPNWKTNIRLTIAPSTFVGDQGTWYRVKIVNSTAENKIYFYVNDLLISSSTNDKLFKSMMILGYMYDASNLYLDTMKYYQGFSITTNAKYTIFGDWINMAYALQGNLKRFWDMTQYDLKILEPISSGQSHFMVDNRNYRDTFQGHERVYILANNKLYGRKISSIQVNPLDSTQEQFNFAVPFPDDLSLAQIERCGYARYSVLSGDIGFNFLTAEQYQASISFTELDTAEYEELL